MSVKVRLHRTGSNKKPFYRIVAADSRGATSGKTLEILGWYDPKKKQDNVKVDMARVDYWRGVGAHVSDTVRTLIKRQKPQIIVSASS